MYKCMHYKDTCDIKNVFCIINTDCALACLCRFKQDTAFSLIWP